MSDGVVCKVWNIHGNSFSKKASAQLGDSMDYILNKEKTNYTVPMEGSIVNDIMAQLQRECHYVGNDIKTLDGTYVGTQNLISDDVNGAVHEMMEVKEFYGKLDGRAALHGIISLPAGESDRERAPGLMKMCSEVIKELFPDHQAVFAVHTNTDNLHIHFIVNSVGLNGRKIHQDNRFITDKLQPCVNKYAKKYGFTPNDRWESNEKNSKGMPYSDIKIRMRALVDYAIEKSHDFDGFVSELKGNNMAVNVGKHISLKMDGMQKAIRTYQLGANYTKDAIIERIKTKYDALQGVQVHQYTMGNRKGDVFTPQITVMKKYKDMQPEEKKRVIRELRLGRNPWRVNQALNWQLNSIGREINSSARVTELAKFYSEDGTIEGTLEGILEAKGKLSAEKKALRSQMKRYKPVIDIYEEMRDIEKKAYLYDMEGMEEYRGEFERYRELSRRLKNGYGKNILEVAAFLEECNERFIYAQAQFDELSGQYKEVKRYGMEHGGLKIQKQSLYDISGIHEALSGAGQGIFDTSVSYVVSKDSEYIVRVYKSAEPGGDGKMRGRIEVSVMDRYGGVVEKFDGLINKEMQKSIYGIQKKYSFNTCEKYTNIIKARSYLDAKTNADRKSSITLHKEKIYSFTQAVNANASKGKEGIHVIVNKDNPIYMAAVITKKDIISIQVADRNGTALKEIEIPALRLKNKKGMEELARLQMEFGFSDEIVSYESARDAKEHTNEAQKANERDKNRAEKGR